MIKQTQQLLADLGYYKGKIDGVWGYQSRQAVFDLAKKVHGDDVVNTTEKTPKKSDWQMKLSDKGFEMLAVFEGFRSAPYRDSVGVPTIGYGNTYYLDGRKVTMSDKPISKDEAKKLKIAVINKDFAPAVNRLLENQIKAGKITQNMFDALISLVYNIGVGALAKSSVINHLKNDDKQKSADAFLLWKNAGGKPILLKRRQKEREVFLA